MGWGQLWRIEAPLSLKSVRSSKMKRNLLVFAVMVVALLFFGNQSWATFPQYPNDLGICDTFYIETFGCDNSYQATGGYDSVRVAIFVTHDSNTFYWQGGQRWVQDSIVSFLIPFEFDIVGCADSLIFPTTWPLPQYPGDWNNRVMDTTNPKFNRSMFRHLVNAHTGDTVYNRFALMNSAGLADWSCNLDVVNKAPGHFYMVLTPMAAECQRWWEGSRVLLATLTFLVYMGQDCDSSAICFDSTFFPTGDQITFIRYDAAGYSPRYFLPVCDTIYDFICGDCNRDGVIDMTDVVYLLNYLFLGGPAPVPYLEAGDATCNGIVDVSDIVFLLNYLFVQGPSPGC
jgi:hypothetical protein